MICSLLFFFINIKLVTNPGIPVQFIRARSLPSNVFGHSFDSHTQNRLCPRCPPPNLVPIVCFIGVPKVVHEIRYARQPKDEPRAHVILFRSRIVFLFIIFLYWLMCSPTITISINIQIIINHLVWRVLQVCK